MSESRNVLLLVGSPRGKNSSSLSLGKYLIDQFDEANWSSETVYVIQYMNREEKKEEFLTKVNHADLIILAFPLYVDSLHSFVIKAMEFISLNRKNDQDTKSPGFIAIGNCGFPESKQIETALKICRIFAQKVGFTWKGGLALGGGEAIQGRPLEERGGLVRNVMRALEITADSLSHGNDIPQEAKDLMSKPLMPITMYKMAGNLGWRLSSKDKNNKLKYQYYLHEK